VDADREPLEPLRRLARRSPRAVGSTASFIGLLVLTLIWIAVGPFFGFSSGWLLVPSALASIAALLLVVLLQYSQNRDTRALQLKLDEVIRAVGDARGELLQLERRSDQELAEIEREFEELREQESR
jgi:low affinity Fe/Cu permease